jgi:hypothetical protein
MSLTVQTQPFLDLLADVALFAGDTTQKPLHGVYIDTGTAMVDGEQAHVLTATAMNGTSAAHGWVPAGGELPACFLRMADVTSLRDLWSKRSKVGKEDPPHGLHLAPFDGTHGMELVASPDAILFDEGAPTLRVPTLTGEEFPLTRALLATTPGNTSRTDIPEVSGWDTGFVVKLGKVCASRGVDMPQISQPRGRLVACVGEQLRVALHAVYDVPQRRGSLTESVAA